jgi:hypothetical protein
MEIDYSVPPGLKSFVASKDYREIIDHAIQYLSRSCTLISLVDGILTVQDADELTRLINLTNLVKNILLYEKEDWPNEIADYLDRFDRDQDLEDYLYMDCDMAVPYLTIRLQPQEAFQNPDYPTLSIEDYVYKSDLEGIYTVLALDLPSRFAMILRKNIADWPLDEHDLFSIAQQNLTGKLESIDYKWHDVDEALIVTLFDRDYAACLAAHFSANYEELVGPFGSVVCLPSRGSVFVHPIETAAAFSTALQWLAEQTNKFFAEEPGALTRTIYWYFEGTFVKFDIQWEGNYLTYVIPSALVAKLMDEASN